MENKTEDWEERVRGLETERQQTQRRGDSFRDLVEGIAGIQFILAGMFTLDGIRLWGFHGGPWPWGVMLLCASSGYLFFKAKRTFF